jgi:hypothetical protein
MFQAVWFEHIAFFFGKGDFFTPGQKSSYKSGT